MAAARDTTTVSLGVIGSGVAAGEVVSAASIAAEIPRLVGLDGAPVSFRGAYVHVPFCFHKCHYCDFYSFVETQGRQPEYVERLLAEARAWAPLVRAPLETLFVGGGTPTLLEPPLLERLLQGLAESLPWAPGAEWSVEANPETVTDAVARTLERCGVNRVSLGCQSFEPSLLKALERWHEPASVPRAMELLRRAGITNLNLDLIFAIPGSTMELWERDLDSALALAPTHLSCYGLVYEPNTPLRLRAERGEVSRIDEELEARMYEHACDRLAASGFVHDEISNWSRPGAACRHNDLYWLDQDWIALGPSASGHAGPWRWKNVPRLGDWLTSSPFSPVIDAEKHDADVHIGERFMLGLRRLEGMPRSQVEALLNHRDGREDAARRRRRQIARAETQGLLQWNRERLQLTRAGLLLADSVLAELVS